LCRADKDLSPVDRPDRLYTIISMQTNNPA
jgi:hypothetical protein